MAITSKEIEPAVIRRTVQDFPSADEGQSPVSSFILRIATAADAIPAWGSAPKARDMELRRFWPTEPVLASAVYSVASRNSSFSWELEGAPQTAQIYKQVLHNADYGRGWERFMMKVCVDLYTQDNGAFVELIRTANRPDAPVIGLAQLDAHRVIRTGDPEVPYIYRDRKEKLHKLRWFQCYALEEMPTPIEFGYNLQTCLHRDASVLMADGSHRRIVDLVRARSTEEVASVDTDGHFVTKRITNWYENERAGREMVNIRGKLSRLVRGKQERNSWVTEDHPILTPSGWKSAGELKTGDKIVSGVLCPNKQQRELLVGSVLGDMSIQRQNDKPRLSMGHSVRQREWFDTKVRALKEFGWVWRVRQSTVTIGSGAGKSHWMIQGQTKANAAFIELHEAFYSGEGKIVPFNLVREALSPTMLAAWYMDDGSIMHPNGHSEKSRPLASFATCGFTHQENVELAALLTKAGFATNVVKNGGGQYKLLMTVEGSARLFELVAPYVVESLRYKLPSDSQPYDPTLWDLGPSEPLIDEVIVRRGRKHDPKKVYCIDVEDTHNFVTAGVVVHNCAVSRCLRAAQILRDIAIYKHEKVSGRFARAIHMVGGVPQRFIDDATKDASFMADQMGLSRYVQPIILASLSPEATVSHIQIDLASLPDGFDEESTMRWYIAQLALAFGVDYQDFAPLPGGNLGSSQQSQILHMKTRGKGPALFMRLIEQMMNNAILPRNVTFRYREQDIDSAHRQAEISQLRAETRAARIESTELTPEVARQIAVDEGDLDQRYLDQFGEQDITTEEVVSDKKDEADIEEGEHRRSVWGPAPPPGFTQPYPTMTELQRAKRRAEGARLRRRG